MKRFTGTWLAILALAGLAAYFFLIEVPEEQKAQQEKIRAQKLVDFDVNQVDEVILKNKGVTLHARITPKMTWELLEPLKTSADVGTLQTLLITLQDARTSRVVDEAPNDLKTYGLDPPVRTLTIKTKDKTHTVEFGNTNPVGHSLYVKRSGEPAVLLITSFGNEWDKSLYDFRDKTVMAYSTKMVTGFTLKQDEKILVFKKNENAWTFKGKVTAKGDTEAIEDLLNTIRASRIDSFIEESATDLKQYGLDQPSMVFSPTDGTRTWTLSVGNHRKEGGAFATIGDKKNVFVIDRVLLNALGTSYLDLIDKSLMDLAEDQVESLTLTEGKESLKVTAGKDATKWNLAPPLSGPADAATVNSLLFDIKQARAHEFVSFGQLSSFGLHKPKQTITLHFKNGKQQSLLLGNTNMAGSQFFASRSEDDAVFVLTEETTRKLFRPLSDFKNRKLLKFESDQVHAIQLQYPKQTFEVLREEESWKLTQPENIPDIPERVARDILWTLDHVEFAEEADKETASSQFETPPLIVSLTDKNKKELAQITIGNPSKKENKIFARTGDKYYLIGNKFLDQIPNSVEQFKK